MLILIACNYVKSTSHHLYFSTAKLLTDLQHFNLLVLNCVVAEVVFYNVGEEGVEVSMETQQHNLHTSCRLSENSAQSVLTSRKCEW